MYGSSNNISTRWHYSTAFLFTTHQFLDNFLTLTLAQRVTLILTH